MKKLVYALTFVLLCVAGVSGYNLWRIYAETAKEAKIHSALLEYKPGQTGVTEPQVEEIVNQNIIDLKEQYPDVVGWLTIPNTNVDYPFAWYSDNDYYLRRTLDLKRAEAGTVFMDYRCDKDFKSRNTIIYGHNMKSGRMFATLKSFNNKEFFEANLTGTIYLKNETITLEFFAYMVFNPYKETELYTPDPSESYVEYVRQNARNYRELNITKQDKIVTLSACSYEFKEARMVLLAKISND